MQRYIKDPDAVLDYEIDWSAWLGEDTISTSSWAVPDGITQDSDSNTDTAATIWVSGGTASQTYRLTNRIATAGGRQNDQSILIRVEEQ